VSVILFAAVGLNLTPAESQADHTLCGNRRRKPAQQRHQFPARVTRSCRSGQYFRFQFLALNTTASKKAIESSHLCHWTKITGSPQAWATGTQNATVNWKRLFRCQFLYRVSSTLRSCLRGRQAVPSTSSSCLRAFSVIALHSFSVVTPAVSQ